MRLSVGAGSRFFVSVEPFKLFASGKLFKLLACHAGLLSGSLAVIILYYMYPCISIDALPKHVPMYPYIFYMYTYTKMWYNRAGKAVFKMPISEARKRANQAYIDKQDEIKVRMPKGRKAEIQAHAEAMGESLNAFVGRAINEAMERDSSGPEK